MQVRVRMETSSRFTVFDFMVFFGTVGLSLFLGIYFGWKNRKHDSVVNYFLANRRLSVLPTAMSLAVTFQSSLMIIGIPAEVYTYGTKYAYYLIGSCSSYIVAGLFVVPVFHPLKLTSANKYFKLRYNDNTIRYLAMSFGIFYYVLYSGAVIFGTCVALEYLIGIPYWGTICICSIVTAIYTSVGGMKAVIWTDVLQISIMAIGVSAIVIKSCIEVGGLSKLAKQGSTRFNFNDFRIDPTIRYQFWNLSFGSFIGFLVTCFQQPGIQRINSTPSIKTARQLYVLSGIIYAILASFVCFEGVAIFAYYNHIGCDPLASGRIDSTNELIPLAVADLFSEIPGLSGLFIAALSSAALSTLSSSLSSLGAVTYDDIIKERYPNISDEKATKMSKIIVFLYGMLAMAFTLMIAALPGTIINVTYAFLGCVDGPTCALFLVSILYRRSTTKGMLAGAFAGIAFMLWLNIGTLTGDFISSPKLQSASTKNCSSIMNPILDGSISYTNDTNTSIIYEVIQNPENTDFSFIHHVYSVSFTLYPLIGCLVSTIVAVPVSLITSPPENYDERCVFNFKSHVWNVLCSQKEEKNQDANNEMEENQENIVERRGLMMNNIT